MIENTKHMERADKIARFKNAVLFSIFMLGAYGVGAFFGLLPESMASQWTPEEMMQSAGASGGLDVQPLTVERLAEMVRTFTSYIVGIAVVLFVLKIVLTAVDRMVLGNTSDELSGGGSRSAGGGSGSSKFRLSDIPVIGAYESDVAWKYVWLHFMKNLAIIAAAWLIVQGIMQIILMIVSFIQG